LLIFAFLGVFVLILIFIIGIYNSLVSLSAKVKEAWSQIDVQLKRRTDLIPNLVETVKGYASHESEVFEAVTKARASLMSASGPKEVGEADQLLGGALKSLLAVAEAYPELKAQANFSELQKELSDTEDKVSYSRQFYNSIVRQYNEKVAIFPNNIIANMFKFQPAEYFEANEADKEPVKVEF
jgi:LemA protein